jgi:hypothetical protein
MNSSVYYDYQQEALRLRAILARGASSVTTDGVTVNYDLAAVRQRLEDINRILNPKAHPRFANINLGGC